MAIKLYETPSPDNPYSQDGAMTNPVRQAFNGRTGGTLEKRLYIRNDNSGYTYSDIQITPIDNTGKDYADGTNGYSWKLYDGYSQPSEAAWGTVTAGDSILLASGLSNIATYYPFWLRIDIPAGAEVESIDDIDLRISCTETLVP